MSVPAVVFGGPSPEHDVSILTGLQVARILSRSGQEPVLLYWTQNREWYQVPAGLEGADFLGGLPAGAKPVVLELGGKEPGFYEQRSLGRKAPVDISAAVICCHGGPGEDGRLQALLDVAGIAYTGPNAACAALAMDKLAFGDVVAALGVPHLPRLAWNSSSPDPSFAGPYIVKPRFGGSSIGIEIVPDADVARTLAATSVHLRRGAVLEPYRPGAVDLYVAIRAYPKLELSLIERPQPSAAGQIYDYKQKYLTDRSAESTGSEIPATLPGELEQGLREAALAVAERVRLSGTARLDFLRVDDEIWVNELNSLPGALALRLWAESGVSREQLVADLLAEATSDERRGHDFDPVDREAASRRELTLRAAGSIADKLA